MTGFRKGFFLAPKKQEPGMHQKYEKTKKLQKMTHDAITSSLEEKLRKQTKSALYQKVSEFNNSGQMRIDQLIKIVINLQVEVTKLRKENTKLLEHINNGLQDTLNLNGQLGEGDRFIMKILMRIFQLDYFLVRRNLETQLKN